MIVRRWASSNAFRVHSTAYTISEQPGAGPAGTRGLKLLHRFRLHRLLSDEEFNRSHQRNPPAKSPIGQSPRTPLATSRRILARDLHRLRILDRLGKVSGYRTHNRRDQVWNHNLQSRLLRLSTVHTPRLWHALSSVLLGIHSCDPFDAQRRQTCLIRVRMTADINHFLTLRVPAFCGRLCLWRFGRLCSRPRADNCREAARALNFGPLLFWLCVVYSS